MQSVSLAANIRFAAYPNYSPMPKSLTTTGVLVAIALAVVLVGCQAPVATSPEGGWRYHVWPNYAITDELPPNPIHQAEVTRPVPLQHAVGYTDDDSIPLSDARGEMSVLPSLPKYVDPTRIESAGFLRLTLGDAITVGLERNPDLAAVRAGESVAQAAMDVAQTYPFNPQFQTQVLPYSRDQNGVDGVVSQQHVVVQTFELGGQQQFRQGVAAATWQQVNGTIRQAELMSAAQTTRLFIAALYQRGLRDLSQSLAELNDQLIGVIERREKAGLANNSDVALARLQAQASRRQQRLAEGSYQTSISNLRTQLNLDQNTPLVLAGDWTNWRWQPSRYVFPYGHASPSNGINDSALETSPVESLDETIVQRLASQRPDVMAARSAVAMASDNLRLADAMRIPNLQLGPMYQRDSSATQSWGVQGQIDIPIVNTGRPLVQQRSAELRQQQISAEQLENKARLEVQAAIRRYERARLSLEQSRGEFESNIWDSLQPFEDQFKAGQVTLLQVFAARATLVQSQQGFLDLLNEIGLAAADVTQATGIPPQQLISQLTQSPESPNEEPKLQGSKPKPPTSPLPKSNESERTSAGNKAGWMLKKICVRRGRALAQFFGVSMVNPTIDKMPRICA